MAKGTGIKDLLKKLGVSLGTFVLIFLLLEVGFRLFYKDHVLTLDLDPELYWVPRANQNTGEARINNVGLRGPDTLEKDPSRYRILTTGDSFTYGERVTDPETWPAQLEAVLTQEKATHAGDGRRIEMLNGGGPGWGIFQMERYLRRAIPRFEPDLVMLAITPVDIYRQPFSPTEHAAYIKAQKRRKALRDVSVFLTFIARRVVRVEQGHRAVPNEQPEGTEKSTLWSADSARIQGLIHDFSGKTRFMILVIKDFSKEHDWVVEHAQSFASEIETPFFDLTPFFAGKLEDEVSVVGDGHPNPAGHAITARALADMLYQRGIAQRP